MKARLIHRLTPRALIVRNKSSPALQDRRTQGQNQRSGKRARARSLLCGQKQWRCKIQPPGICLRQANLSPKVGVPSTSMQAIRSFSRRGVKSATSPLCEISAPRALRVALEGRAKKIRRPIGPVPPRSQNTEGGAKRARYE